MVWHDALVKQGTAAFAFGKIHELRSYDCSLRECGSSVEQAASTHPKL